MTEAIFFKVTTVQAKLSYICSAIQKVFENGNKILIAAPNLEAAQYIDQLLWRMPEESFLPHVLSNTFSQDSMVITAEHKNFNKAKILFNLCPYVSPFSQEFDCIYELFDETHPSKAESSSQRLSTYVAQGIAVRQLA